MKKALIAAGGTGGHLLPAQQLGELLEKKQGMQVVFAGYKLDKSPYFRREEFPFCEVPAAPLGSWKFLWQLLVGTWCGIRMLLREKPDVVVGFGSYHTVPVLCAAVLLRKKVVLFEANRTLGKVNRLFRPFATRVAWQFLGKRGEKDIEVKRFPWVERKRWKKEEARKELGLEADKFTVLVFGGSQGAQFFNEIVPQVAEQLPEIQWLHIAGNETAANEIRSRFVSGKVFSFCTDMPLLYAAADAAICRSGAGTISELIRFEVPALLIPYPHATDNHQWHNAQTLVQAGGAVCVLQQEATVAELTHKIQTLDWKQMALALRKCKEHNEAVEIDSLVGKL